MHLILYTIKNVLLKGKKTYPPRYLCVMYGTSLKAARFQQTAYFFPLTHPQLLHKMATRPLTVVKHSYGKVEYIQLIFLTP